MIVNELVSNCLKHAFTGQRQGAVLVKLHNLQDNMVSLTVRDDGNGFSEPFEVQKALTLGLRLVNDLAKQLKGDLQIAHKGRTEFKVVFPAESQQHNPLLSQIL